MRQASPNDLSETDACGLRTQDKLLDWLIAQRKHATEPSVSAGLLGLRVTYEGTVLDPARVLLHRSPEPVVGPGDGEPRHAGDRPTLPGEFLG